MQNEEAVPNKNALIYLEKLLFHGNDNLSQKIYGENPTNELDVDRCVNGLPCWGEISIGGEERRKKKLIITDWSICFDIADRNEVQAMWSFLLSQGAEVYVWIGELKKIDNIYHLMAALDEVEPISREEIYQQLSKKGNKIAKDDCEIIDSQRTQEILFNLQSITLWIIGIIGHSQGFQKVFQSNTVRDKKQFSYFYLGQLIVEFNKLDKLIINYDNLQSVIDAELARKW